MNLGQTYWSDTIPTQRLVVLEWLGSGEQRTGSDLVSRISQWGLTSPVVELQTCASKLQVLDALRILAEEVPTRGVPILHIEAHGAKGQEGGLAPDSSCSDFIAWRELRQPLRALNLATGFNLLVVGAACYGEGFLWAIGEVAPAPFVSCVGFARAVGDSALRDMMIEFYRDLFVRKENVEVAADNATRAEARNPQQEYLRMTSVRTLLLKAIQNAFQSDWTMEPKARFANEVALAARIAIASGGRAKNPFAQVHDSAEWTMLEACETVVSAVLAYEMFPHNRQRFNVDLKSLFREARRGASAERDA